MANLPYSRLQLRRGDKEFWKAHDVVLYEGEPALEVTTTRGTNGQIIQKCKMKIGDGINPWSKLKYMSGSGSEGGSGTVSITVTGVTTSVPYRNPVNSTWIISVNSECSKISIGDNVITNITTTDDINYTTSYTLKIDSLTESKSFTIIAYNDEGLQIATKTIIINPSYQIIYWLADKYEGTISSYSGTSPYITGLTTDGIDIKVPEHDDSNLYLYIGIPKAFGVPVFDNSGFIIYPEEPQPFEYNNIQYNIYQVGSMGLITGTVIKIKK